MAYHSADINVKDGRYQFICSCGETCRPYTPVRFVILLMFIHFLRTEDSEHEKLRAEAREHILEFVH
jgi:hypothetical protein